MRAGHDRGVGKNRWAIWGPDLLYALHYDSDPQELRRDNHGLFRIGGLLTLMALGMFVHRGCREHRLQPTAAPGTQRGKRWAGLMFSSISIFPDRASGWPPGGRAYIILDRTNRLLHLAGAGM